MDKTGNPKLVDNQTQYKPKPYTKKRYYTPNDVRVHNIANDCWVTLFNEVFDLTDLVQEFIERNLFSSFKNNIFYF